jgi:hypothetical protein
MELRKTHSRALGQGVAANDIADGAEATTKMRERPIADLM